VEALVARVRDAYGRVDVLVNNAGLLGGQSVLEMSLERWTRQLAVNLTGTFLCTKHVARLMVERQTRGSIIVIVSTAGHQGQAGNIGYCTSKSGLLNFTRAAAMDLARHGIRVNSLTPTATDTSESLERAVAWGRPKPEARPRMLDFARMIPSGALPSPRHYARAAVFLASDDAEMITGFDLRVDAGAIAKYWPWVPNP
jgi:NAD(P)-dependent dehydrogenase (short-subunit alcohol dehydrogenase family)